MRISVLTIGAIASIISTAAFADTTVTSKQYVDTTRQATIPVTGTNANTPGSTVVTYTSTAGTIGERGICNDPADNCNQADIATFGLVGNAVEYIQNNMPTGTANNVVTYDSKGDIGGERGIYDGSTTYDSSTDADKLVTASVVQNATNLPETTVAYKTCTDWVAGMPHSDNNCLLWDFGNKVVNGGCTTNNECSGRCKMCVDGACVDNPNCAA